MKGMITVMYNINLKQYIFRQSSNKVWNIFYDEKRGLCYSNMSKNNVWLEPVVIHKNTDQFFFANIDEKDTIHIIYQDKSGNINYSSITDTVQTNFPILSSKQPSPYNKHLSLIPQQDNLHTLFVLNHKDSFILAHQLISSENAVTPRVIDYLENTDSTYSVLQDNEKNLYAFYQSFDGKFTQLVYKKYNVIQKSWGESTPLTSYSGNCSFVNAIANNRDVFHICYQRQKDRRYELIYQQKVSDKNTWTPEIVVHNSAYAFVNSGIISLNDEIILFWVRDDAVFYSNSKNSGTTWSKPSRYNFSFGRQLFCLSYKSNTTFEKGKVIAPSIPGNLSNGLKLAFYQDLIKNESSASNTEPKRLTVDDIIFFKKSIEELRELYNTIDNKTQKMIQMHQSLEKEIIKYSVKMRILENDLTQLKQTVPQNMDFNAKMAESNELLESHKNNFMENEKIFNTINYRIDDIAQKISEIKDSVNFILNSNPKAQAKNTGEEEAESDEALNE
jgi:hypothetical protein